MTILLLPYGTSNPPILQGLAQGSASRIRAAALLVHPHVIDFETRGEFGLRRSSARIAADRQIQNDRVRLPEAVLAIGVGRLVQVTLVEHLPVYRDHDPILIPIHRSEERRVGKERR